MVVPHRGRRRAAAVPRDEHGAARRVHDEVDHLAVVGVLVSRRLRCFGVSLDLRQNNRSLGHSFSIVRVNGINRRLNSLELQLGGSGRFSGLSRRSESSIGGSGDSGVGGGIVSRNHGFGGSGLSGSARSVERRCSGVDIHGGVAHSLCHSRCLGGILGKQGGHGIGPG